MWRGNRPILMRLAGTNDLFLPVFSTEEKLQAMDMPFDSVRRIDDMAGFLGSLPFRTLDGCRLRIIVDPYQTARGTTRFREIWRPIH